MRAARKAGCAILAAAAAAASLAAAFPSPMGSQDGLPRAAVLVELFTSEGCSDCPPADTLLARLASEQPIRTAEVIAIEEHVDYWDQEGWRDPFSSAEWTDRQRSYAQVLPDHGVYTPEMVVDGSASFVGSRSRESGERIAAAAAHPKAAVSVASSSERKNRADVQVRVGSLANSGDDRSPAEVWLAVTESGLHSAVTAGENHGQNLFHAPVLRKMQKLGAAERGKEQAFAGRAEIALDGRWNPRNLMVIAFVQDKRSKRILGASSTKLMATP